MKKTVIALAILIPFSLFGDTEKRKVYVNVHTEGFNSQIGVEKGSIYIYDEPSGRYTRYLVKDGKIVRELSLKKDQHDKGPVVWMDTFGYCPGHHVERMGK